MAEWLDMEGWHPNDGEAVFCKAIAARINHTLKELALEHGLDAKRFSTHSLRAGCAATLYAAGVDPVDIQSWGRWKSGIYMRYIWHDNVRLQHLSKALTSTTKLMEHLKVEVSSARKVGFANDFRAGSTGKSNDDDVNSTVLQRFDFFSSPEAERIHDSQSDATSGGSRSYPNTGQLTHSPITGNVVTRECKIEDFVSSNEPHPGVRVKYETEPNALGVKVEGSDDLLAKQERVKKEEHLRKEEEKEEVKDEVKNESIEWEEGGSGWRVKSECQRGGDTLEARTAGSGGSAFDSGAGSETGESDVSDEKNGYRSSRHAGERSDAELVESEGQSCSELVGENLCRLEAGGYVPSNARSPCAKQKRIDFRMGSSGDRNQVVTKVHKIKLAPGRPLGFRMISARSQRRESSIPPNLRGRQLRRTTGGKGKGGKESCMSRGRSVVTRSLRREQEEKVKKRGKQNDSERICL